MNNPETEATLDTRHRTKKPKAKYTTQKIKRMNNTDHTKTSCVNQNVREG